MGRHVTVRRCANAHDRTVRNLLEEHLERMIVNGLGGKTLAALVPGDDLLGSLQDGNHEESTMWKSRHRSSSHGSDVRLDVLPTEEDPRILESVPLVVHSYAVQHLQHLFREEGFLRFRTGEDDRNLRWHDPPVM